MVDKIKKRLPSKPVEKDYLVDFVNKELVPQMERLRLLTSSLLDILIQGEGSPEGVVAAAVGSIYQQTDGGAGTSVWVKETGGSTDTGWAPK
jgi:hypothetical protein